MTNLSKSISLLLQEYDQYCLIAETASLKHALPAFEGHLDMTKTFMVELDYEVHDKTLDTCKHIWDAFLENQVTDRTLVINFGSGTVCDIGGFASSTFHFGLDFIHVPTTLVAQVGASVGGKMGIDYSGIKNALGVYRNPRAVFIDCAFLQTLPEHIFNGGLVEILKYGLLAGGSLWQMLQRVGRIEPESVKPFLEKALIFKKQILETDPMEKGFGKILEFGNTIGHAIRRYAISQEEKLHHGQYIASGIICEAYLSKIIYEHPDEWLDAIVHRINPFAFHANWSDEVLEEIGNSLTFYASQKQEWLDLTLLKDVGTARYDIPVEKQQILDALSYWKQQGNK